MSYGSNINGWTMFLKVFLIGPGILIPGGLILGVLYSSSESEPLGIVSGALFLATAALPFLWFTIADSYVDLFRITWTY